MKLMKINGLLLGTVVACLMVGVSGPVQAQPREDTREIILDFCESIAEEAADTIEKLENAAEDLAECTDDFFDCRDGGLFGNDPLVECIGKGINCAARSAEDKVQACGEFVTDYQAAYERALRQARRQGPQVEDLVQDFFNEPSPERRVCLNPAIEVAQVCADTEEE